MKASLELPDDRLVSLRALAKLMAAATRRAEDDIAAELLLLARENRQGALKLPTVDPETLAAATSDGISLDALVEPLALFEYVKTHGVELFLTSSDDGPRYWTIEAAAASLTKQEGRSSNELVAVRNAMVGSAAAGTLPVRNPETGFVYRPARVRDFYDLVSPDDVNKWLLEVARTDLRWTPSGEGRLTPKPAQRWTTQENEIVAQLTKLGFDPVALPRPEGRGVHSPAKLAARKATGFSSAVFDKAWKRLRKAERIKDAR